MHFVKKIYLDALEYGVIVKHCLTHATIDMKIVKPKPIHWAVVICIPGSIESVIRINDSQPRIPPNINSPNAQTLLLLNM